MNGCLWGLILTVLLACQCAAQTNTYATNWFGESRSEPICSGYVFLAGRYVDAPYVVEQRGYAIFINGAFIEYAVSPALVYPEAVEPPVTVDPGLPSDLSYTNTIGDAMNNPVTRAKGLYLQQQGLSPDENARRYVAYFQSLPCISRVEVLDYPSNYTSIEFAVYDRASNCVHIGIEPHASSRPSYTHAQLKKEFIVPARSRFERLLESDYVILASGRGVLQLRQDIQANAYWQSIISVLDSDLPLAAKMDQLRAAGFIEPSKSDEQAASEYGAFLQDFKGSGQLHRRVQGDEGWRTSCIPESVGASHDAKPVSPTPVSEGLAIAGTQLGSNAVHATATDPGGGIEGDAASASNSMSGRFRILIVCLVLFVLALLARLLGRRRTGKAPIRP